jgi:hypothetical protein
MLTLNDSSQILTNHHRKGPRACRTQTGFFMGQGEACRVYRARLGLLNRRLRLAWLVKRWNGHQARINTVKENHT